MYATTKRNLQLHVKSVHDGVKYKYNCEPCDTKATTKSSLCMYMYNLSMKELNIVKFCDYKASKWKYVQSVHEGIKYDCNVCEYKVTRRNSLLRHVKSEHEGFKYYCKICEYNGTQK